MRRGKIGIIKAFENDKVFGSSVRNQATWSAWKAFLRVIFGEKLSPEDFALYQKCTGGRQQVPQNVTEVWLTVGRRGGKSFTLAIIAVYLAIFVDWRKYLVPGELGTIMIIATDRRQARVIFRYIQGLIYAQDAFKRMIVGETNESIRLNNSIIIEVQTASFRTVRGYTIIAALLDEIAFWRDDSSANPDEEILKALRPAMSTIPGALLLCASSPYARRGILYKTWKDFYGRDADDILVWQAATEVMNPSIPAEFLAREYDRDPVSAAAEYGADFRADIDGVFTLEAVERCLQPDVTERPPFPDHRYFAFVDAAGGSGTDSMTLGIAHYDFKRQVRVLDCIRERRPPFSPEDVVEEFCNVVRSYGLNTVMGDHYSGEWVRERFSERGMSYEPCPVTKSDLYRELIPIVNAQQVELLDIGRLTAQMVALERRTSRAGKDSIDHPPRGHDDLVNVAAGASVYCAPALEKWDASQIVYGQELVGNAVPWLSENLVGEVDGNYLA